MAALEGCLTKTGQAHALRLWTRLFDACLEEPTSQDMALAEELIALVQAEFARRENECWRAVRDARDVWRLHAVHEVSPWMLFQETAVRAMTRRYGGTGRFAKETQIGLAGGRPLAACVGTLTHDRVPLVGAESFTFGHYGWGAIFEDSTRTSGRPWSTTCPACRGKRSERRRAAVRVRRRLFVA